MLENTPAQILAPLLQMEGPRTNPSRIAIKAEGKILLINPAEVVTVEAQGNYVLLQRMAGSAFLLRQSLSVVAEKLLPYGFVRIHRSTLVNAAYVEEIHSWTTGEYVLRIQGGKEFPVSRTFRRNLHAIAPLWLGTEGFLPD
ncbi:MAG TPA: LytTR family DNA-binding domain-containing protein [Candidatus Acidoferrum sp.]|jgi:DNA-binding LytR/AlgR family response regulator|nr:LytTR family DNA-binding domain-containing protein [Candidatus Acidoferrum sp.]